jgi:hypothetical protein
MVENFIENCKKHKSFKKIIGSNEDLILSFTKNFNIYIDNNNISIDDENYCQIQEDLSNLIYKLLETLTNTPYNKGERILYEFEILCFMQDNKIKTNFYTDSFSSILNKMTVIDNIRNYVSVLYGYGYNIQVKKIFSKYKIL